MTATDAPENVAGLIREAIARRRISRQQLADEARISLSTLEKALAGQRPFTINTLVRLEDALGISLRRQVAAGDGPADPALTPGIAPEALGAYSRLAVAWLEGDYCVVRPSFSGGEALYTYQTTIAWSDECSHLVFRESERVDAACIHRPGSCLCRISRATSIW